ncbi:hypothetical protein WJ59_17355 [Burkholderia gladioli]|uniref:hypothetical protein n=1 Tax=Burkholderia TaxID=32008 RepID=UPI00068A8242|nr:MULTISPECIES: hypothetical protein [Burkholderia]KVM65410.1 hypothetical protein WJ59_17355 [Burkholderia gladioli]MBJ9673343.1 hypothetical protein [Burkholderia gladioli]MBU9382077.1 hypothetical protein [Burkholderia gladioli]MDN7460191.1 hypothetical protein [Burkholderia gladioli]NIE82669.1 hypothetical protein [Burkholderia sp. Tr-860]
MLSLNLSHGNIHQLPIRADSHYDALQAKADEAEFARNERNDRIDDALTFDAYDVSPEAGALIDAALCGGRIEDLYVVFDTLRAARTATLRRLIAEADHEEAREVVRRGTFPQWRRI